MIYLWLLLGIMLLFIINKDRKDYFEWSEKQKTPPHQWGFLFYKVFIIYENHSYRRSV